jgi:DNA-binding beta-propeller fold protein YncE
VARIDTTTGEVVDTFDTGDAPGGIAVTETDLWVTNTEDDTVSRIGLD